MKWPYPGKKRRIDPELWKAQYMGSWDLNKGGKMEEDYINIKFQEGPVKERGVNGCQIEEVIDVLVVRLKNFQNGMFRCRENALTITKLEEAKLWLQERTRKRKEQGVEGTNLPHKD